MMKNYERPKMKIAVMGGEDIIQTSGGGLINGGAGGTIPGGGSGSGSGNVSGGGSGIFGLRDASTGAPDLTE